MRRAGWGPECCISGGGAKLRSWPFPSRSRREGGGPSGRILSVPCPGYPVQSPGAFQPRILWPRTGPDAREGSRTITCLRQRGPSGHRSVSLAPITGTWTWSQAPPPLEGRRVRQKWGDHSQEGSAPASATGAVFSRPGTPRWKRFCGLFATSRSPNVCRMKAKGWLFAFFSFGGLEGGRTEGTCRQPRGGSASAGAAKRRSQCLAQRKEGLAEGPGRRGGAVRSGLAGPAAAAGSENLDCFC